MGMFDWLIGDENTTQNLSPVTGNLETSGLRVETSESAKTIAEVKSRPKRKTESGGTTFTLEKGDAAANLAAEDAAKILDAILDPKIWRGVVAAPGDMMVAVTGREHWELSEDERDTLAKTGAATARAFAVTDPKWLALSLFAFSILSIYGGRITKDLKDKRDAKKNVSLATQNVP